MPKNDNNLSHDSKCLSAGVIGDDFLLKLIQSSQMLEIVDRHVFLTLYISLAKRPVKFLVDTGATLTFMKSKLLQIGSYVQVTEVTTFYGVAGFPLFTLGAVFAHFMFDRYKLPIKIGIVDESVRLNADGILGMDFLEKYAAIIDIDAATITLTIPVDHEAYEPGKNEIILEYLKRKGIESNKPTEENQTGTNNRDNSHDQENENSETEEGNTGSGLINSRQDEEEMQETANRVPQDAQQVKKQAHRQSKQNENEIQRNTNENENINSMLIESKKNEKEINDTRNIASRSAQQTKKQMRNLNRKKRAMNLIGKDSEVENEGNFILNQLFLENATIGNKMNENLEADGAQPNTVSLLKFSRKPIKRPIEPALPSKTGEIILRNAALSNRDLMNYCLFLDVERDAMNAKSEPNEECDRREKMNQMSCNQEGSNEILNEEEQYNGMNECENEISREERRKLIMDTLTCMQYSQKERAIIKGLCQNYFEIFYLEGDRLTYTNTLCHRIHIKPGSKPIMSRQYRLPKFQHLEIDRQLSKMLVDGIIEPSTSVWNSPVFLVDKKDIVKLDQEKEPEIIPPQKAKRLVVDFRKLNEITLMENFPIPLVDEILDELHDTRFFAKLDMHQAFHQIVLHPEDRDYTGFTFNNFKYRWARMPMGLCTAPLTWQRAINIIFQDYIGKGIFIYLDDILIYSKDLQEHIIMIEIVMRKLRESNLKLKLEKCEFFKENLEYLGHIISKDGCRPDPRKVECIDKYPQPKKLTHVQRFLGMINYYRRYIRDCAKIAKPLYNLSKKDQPFEWTHECETAFNELKSILINGVILQFPDFEKTFLVTTDASNFAVGAVLSQGEFFNDRPIQFFSKTLNETQSRYATIEKELLSIVMAIENFRHYIYGREFIVITDHKPLIYLFKSKNISGRLHRWRADLMNYNFKILHRAGTLNSVADALSRIPISIEELVDDKDIRTECMAITRAQVGKEQPIPISDSYTFKENRNVLLNPSRVDHIFFLLPNSKCNILKKLEEKIKRKIDLPAEMDHTHNIINEKRSFFMATPKIYSQSEIIVIEEILKSILQYSVKNNFLEIAINIDLKTNRCYSNFKRSLRVIFKESTINANIYLDKLIEVTSVEDIKEILEIYHRSLLGGHMGMEKMKHTIRQFYKWPSMVKDIMEFVKKCPECEKAKVKRHTKTPMQITSAGEKTFDHTFIDFQGPINPPSAEGHRYIFTAICDLTKMVIAIPTFDMTAQSAAQALVENVFLQYNIPTKITSDNGASFTSMLFKSITRMFKAKGITTTPYHPQANIVERFHRELNEYLKIFVEKNATIWHELLKYAVFSHNNSVNTSTGFTPHELAFGFSIELPTSLNNRPTIYNYDDYLNELRINLFESQKLARENLLKRKMENKNSYDKRSNELILEEGDLVLKKREVTKGKYDSPYEGPYRVEKIINESNVQIRKGKQLITTHRDKLIKAKADYDIDDPDAIIEIEESE